MDRIYSTDQAADAIGQKASRLREFNRNGYLTPRRVGEADALVWSEADLEIARLVAMALDAGCGWYSVRALAERLSGCSSADAVRKYAASLALGEVEGVWKLFDGNLDGSAHLRIARGARVVRFA
jgi:hypothetical protein